MADIFDDVAREAVMNSGPGTTFDNVAEVLRARFGPIIEAVKGLPLVHVSSEGYRCDSCQAVSTVSEEAVQHTPTCLSVILRA